ncbi:hypothetical protein KR52_11570 [Synechococcus sp. KORDI-52]|nr:hypothetical protein KR52_11570 [Synechococcus sp. KORDI-52]
MAPATEGAFSWLVEHRAESVLNFAELQLFHLGLKFLNAG